MEGYYYLNVLTKNKPRMKRLLLFLSAILYSFAVLYGQSTNTSQSFIPTLIPPSPNTSSLGKYANWPVNLYTGTTNISIPIYSLQVRGFSVPVTLNYHPSGIKVGEVASWVGLGWSLEAGGAISRSVRGLPDEVSPQGYFEVRKNYPVPGDLSSSESTQRYGYYDSLYNFGAVQGKFDLESDIYMFSALGRSFKFYFNSNDSAITQPANDIKIKWNRQPGNMLSNSWFEADLDDGTRLLFTATEITTLQTNLNSYVSAANRFISGWYLSTIITNSGDEIDLTYNTSGIYQDSHVSEIDYVPNAGTPGGFVSCACSADLPATKNASVNFNTQSVTQLSVATIESPLIKIYFNRDSIQRLDLNGDYALKNIKVLSKLSNSYIGDYRFIYTYSTSSGGYVPGGYSPSSPDTGSYTRRLKLLAVQNCLPNTPTKINEWDFGYNPLSLPSRRSCAQDHWGYNNGAVSNQTLLPSLGAFLQSPHKNGNREPDSNYVQAEMLNRVTYPTGGHSNFTYEANSYVTTQEVFQDTTVSLAYDLDYPLQETTLSKTYSFMVTNTQVANINFHGIYSPIYVQNHSQGNTMPAATIAIVGGSMITRLSLNATGTTGQTIALGPGNYTLTLTRDTTHILFPNDSNHSAVYTNITYFTSKGVQTFNKVVGGVRIKAIDDFDSATSVVKHRAFIYENPLFIAPVDTTRDYTGTLSEQHAGFETDWNGNQICTYIPGDCLQPYLVRYSNTKYALGSIQGGVIGYGKVTTTYGVGKGNGKSVSYFSNISDDGTMQSRRFPFPPVTSCDWRRGLLTSQLEYDTIGQLKKKTNENYWFFERDHTTVAKSGCNIYYNSGYGLVPGIWQTVYYDLIQEEVRDTATIETIYNTTGDSTVMTKYNYWDNYNYSKPNRSEHYDSKGFKHSQVLTYPKDYLPTNGTSTGNAVLDTMIAKNLFTPIEMRDSVIIGSSHSIVGAILTQNKRLSTGSIQADKIFKLSITSPVSNFVAYNASNGTKDSRYAQEISFDQYDSSNNIAQFTPRTGSSSSYIWDYRRQYPIAETKAAALTDVAYTSFESDGKGGWTFIGTPAADATAPTGTMSYNLSSGPISKSGLTAATTYIVSYWSKSGSYTVTNGGTPLQGKTINGWTYYEHQVTGATSITISGASSIDELRIYPSRAQMTTFAYLPGVGISHLNDINNRITYFVYDPVGRLIYKMDQDRNVLGKYDYSFATHAFYNSKQQQSFTRNNCGAGYNGSSVVYTVDSAKYSSPVSKAAADALAQAEINANGQNYANANGTCTIATTTISSTVYGSITGFKVTYTNTSTSQTYQFTIPSSGGTLGSIPLGTYNINISKTGNTTTYYMSVNCDAYGTDGTSATFNNIVIGSSTCTTVHLDTRL
jgi:hypothetical protein